MRGNDNIYEAARTNLMNTLYPGSITGNVSGGDPDHIPEMEWQDLKDYHAAYYHPANALAFVYGEVDIARFLQQIDSYYSGFDSSDIPVDDGVIKPGQPQD